MSQSGDVGLCSLQELCCPHRSLRVALMLSYLTTKSCLTHGGVSTGWPCHLSATRGDLQGGPSSAPAPTRPLLLGIPAGIPVLGASAASQGAVAVPWVLLQLLQWYFRQRCCSGKTGRKPFQCQHRDLFEGSSWDEEPNCSFSVYVLQGATTQTPANPLSFVRESKLLLEHLPLL